VVFSYENGHRTRVISDLHQKVLLCEVVQNGSYSRDEGEETIYYMDSHISFGESRGNGNTELSHSSAPTTLKFFTRSREILSIEVWYASPKETHPGDPVIEKVEKYIIRQKSSKVLDYNFENPVLNGIIEKYSLDFTRGMTYGK
jgi:hypothetical protein